MAALVVTLVASGAALAQLDGSRLRPDDPRLHSRHRSAIDHLSRHDLQTAPPSPTAMVAVDSLPVVGSALWSGPWAVDMEGDYAYGAHSYGLSVYDLSIPASPQLVAQLYLPGFGDDIKVDRHLAYFADDFAGLYVIDVSDPRSPFVVGSIDTPGEAASVAKLDNCIYIADADAGLEIVDVSNPAVPVQVGHYPTPGPAWSVSAVENRLSVTIGDSGLLILDVSRPSEPVELAHYSTAPYTAMSVAATPELTFLGISNHPLAVLDTHDPTSPSLLTQLTVIAWDVSYRWGYAFVAEGAKGLVAIRASDPKAIAIAGSRVTKADADGVAVAGDLACVAEWGFGLETVDAANPASLAPVGNLQMFRGWMDQSAACGDYLCTVASETFQVLDIRNPSRPLRIGTGSSSYTIADLRANGDRVYTVNSSALEIFDFSDPGMPIKVGTVAGLPGAAGVAIDGRTAYVSYDSAFAVVDVSDATAPRMLGECPLPALAGWVCTGNGFAFVGSAEFVGATDSWLRVVRVSDPHAPEYVASVRIPGRLSSIDFAGSFVVAAARDSGLEVVDVLVPESPKVVGNYRASGRAYSAYGLGDYVLLGHGRGADLLDLSNPTQPALRARFERPIPWQTRYHVTALGRHAFLTDYEGVRVLELPCLVAVTGDVDRNGEINAADIIRLVNYVFRDGPPARPIPEAGDVNCDHSVSAADLIYLVNHVFKAGPPPCDVCAIS